MRTEDVGALNGGDRAGPGRAAAWGAALLAVAGTLGATQVYWKNFVDEADNLAGGLLIARGHALYRDVFSHHLPFPYYWVAAVIWLCGKSILAVRLSVLVFETTIFAAQTKNSRSGYAVPTSIVRAHLATAGSGAVSTQACAPP